MRNIPPVQLLLMPERFSDGNVGYPSILHLHLFSTPIVLLDGRTIGGSDRVTRTEWVATAQVKVTSDLAGLLEIATETVQIPVPTATDRAEAIRYVNGLSEVEMRDLLTSSYPTARRYITISISAEGIETEETIATWTGFWNGTAIAFEDLFQRYGKKSDQVIADWENSYGSFDFRAAGIGSVNLKKGYLKSVKGNFAGEIAPAQYKVFNGDDCEWVDGKLLDFCEAFDSWCTDGTDADTVPAYGTWQIKYNSGLKNKKMTKIIPAGYTAEGDDDDDDDDQD